MKKNTMEYSLGDKLFGILFCGVVPFVLATAAVASGVLQKAQMLFVAPFVTVLGGYGIWQMNFSQPIAVVAGMKRISTSSFSGKLFTFMFSGFLAFYFVSGLTHGFLQKAPMFLVWPCVMAVMFYIGRRITRRDLMDEVYDCGDCLLVKKRGEEDTVLLSNINWVNFSIARHRTNPRITLCLDTPGKFGRAISFQPPTHIFQGSTSEIAEDLRVRVDKARSAHAV